MAPLLVQNPEHKEATSRGFLVCSYQCKFPVVSGVPRFVPNKTYASAFGLQWKRFRKVQLDSYTGTTISRDRLARCLGFPLNLLGGMKVLEAGCGAGRFTELVLSAGAHVFACDLSDAVEANRENCRSYSNYFVCQADILKLPLAPSQFDVVIALGVIQHTPNPERTIEALCSQLKEGGLLVMDHYTYGYPTTLSRRVLRSILVKGSGSFSIGFCEILVRSLWPEHRFLWKMRHRAGIRRIREYFVNISPVVDYHDAYPQLGPKLLRDWAILDTHDTLTDVYKHLRSKEEIKDHLHRCGMVDVEAVYAGNGVEARARKPIGKRLTGQGRKGALE
jgi:SAM-dependent methyltransferase